MSQPPEPSLPCAAAPGEADVLAIVHRFLAALRHPLAEILALSHPVTPPLGEPARSRRDAQLRESAELISTLQAQVGELLDLAHGQAATMLGPVDAAVLVQFAAAVLTPDATAARVELVVDALPRGLTMRANRHLASRVLLNVVSNAIRYTDAGGQVHLTLSSDAKAVEVTVRDTGIGMTERELEHLFRPFERFGKELSSTEGTGMGLATSRRLMQLMNGRIMVSSHKNQGTKVSLRWPLEPPDGVPPAAPIEPSD